MLAQTAVARPTTGIDVSGLNFVLWQGAVRRPGSGQKTSLENIVKLIAEGKGIADHTRLVRGAEPGSDKHKSLKESSWNVRWGGNFTGVSATGADHEWVGSGLVFVDIDPTDKVGAPPDAGEKLIETFRDHPNVVIAYPSVGGKGLHVVYRVDPIPSHSDHRHAFGACKADAERVIGAGYIVDKTPDPTRIAFLSHYPDVGSAFNPAAEALPWSAPTVDLAPPENLTTVKAQPAGGGREPAQVLKAAEVREALNHPESALDKAAYDDWLHVLMALHGAAETGDLYPDDAWDIGVEWSEKSERFNEKGQKGTWGSLKGRPEGKAITLAIIFDALPSEVRKALARKYAQARRTDADGINPDDESHGLTIAQDSLGLKAMLDVLSLEMRLNARTLEVEIQRKDYQEPDGWAWYSAFGRDTIPPDGWIPLTDGIADALRQQIARRAKFKGGKPAWFAPGRWAESVNAHCEYRRVDPVKDWLLSRLPTWDKTPRVETIFTDVLGAANTPLNRAAARSFLVGAVRRTMTPGEKHDEIVCLIGPQGVGKSTFAEGLIPPMYQHTWFSSQPDFAESVSKQVEGVGSSLIVEFSELPGLSHGQLNTIKGYITRRTDRVRLAYRKNAEGIPRRWVGIGTANDDGGGVLPFDGSGNRRFIAVETPGIAGGAQAVRNYLADHRLQIWAEAVYLHETGVPDWLDTAELEIERDTVNRTHTREDETLAAQIEGLAAPKGTTLWEILVDLGLAVSVEDAARKPLEGRRVARALTAAGWRRRRVGKNRLWFTPATATADVGAPPEPEKIPSLPTSADGPPMLNLGDAHQDGENLLDTLMRVRRDYPHIPPQAMSITAYIDPESRFLAWSATGELLALVDARDIPTKVPGDGPTEGAGEHLTATYSLPAQHLKRAFPDDFTGWDFPHYPRR